MPLKTHMNRQRKAGNSTWHLDATIAWLEEDVSRCMIVAYNKELHRLRERYPHIKHQLLPMPKYGHNGRHNTHIFIDRISELDEDFMKNADLTNDQIKAWLGRPVIIEKPL